MRATDPIDVTFGCYEVAGYRVPYMSAILSVSAVNDYLNLVAEDPKYQDHAWTVEELFQRDVNISRVKDIADNYLSDDRARRPVFFNSLTVVLHTTDGNADNHSPPPDKPKHSGPDELLVGPIRIDWTSRNGAHSFPVAGDFASLSWNKTAVYAVAIDGQHRLAALKAIAGRGTEAAKRSSVSVLFLVLDERIGFTAGADSDPMLMMRSIFIDLNKHAQPVSRARNLLLDDRDPIAVCLRSVIGKSLQFQLPRDELGNELAINGPLDFPVGADGEFNLRIPLSLVDWHGEQKSKVDRGPYATSILALEWSIRQVLGSAYLGAKNVDDLTALTPDDDNYYAAIEAALSQWPSLKLSATERLEEAKENQQAFTLTVDDCGLIAGDFVKRWGLSLIRLLCTAGPYRHLANRRLKENSLSSLFGLWAQADANLKANNKANPIVRKHFEEQLAKVDSVLNAKLHHSGKKFSELVASIERDVKGRPPDDAADTKGCILFYLTGQRALVYALRKLVEARLADEWAEITGHLSLLTERGPADYCSFLLSEAVSCWYKRNQELFDKSASVRRRDLELTADFSSKFWAGSIVFRDSESIDFGGMAAKRTAEWLVFLAVTHWLFMVNKKVSWSLLREACQGGDARDEVSSMGFGQTWLLALDSVMGIGSLNSTSSEANNHPIAFLAKPNDSATDDHIRALTLDRIDFLKKCYGDN